jgi:hypothetical protein
LEYGALVEEVLDEEERYYHVLFLNIHTSIIYSAKAVVAGVEAVESSADSSENTEGGVRNFIGFEWYVITNCPM